MSRRLVLVLLLAAWPAHAESPADAACRPPSSLADPPPVLAVRGPAHKGTDRSIEPFALLQMEAAAAWRGRRDEAAATRAIAALVLWSRAGALAEIVEASGTHSNTNSVYSLRRALIAVLGAWMDLRSAPSGRIHAEEIERWLTGLIAAQDVTTGSERSRATGKAASNHNNHVLLRATVAAQWAALTGRRHLAEGAQRVARSTLAEMRDDGSLPLETARGTRALWYQRHALSSLVYIAELVRPVGHDLWRAPASGGADLHHAVAFLLDAIDDPGRLAAYTGDADARRQDLGFLELRGNGRHYMAWAELYRARFPERSEARRLAALMPSRGTRGWPLLDDYVGGNTTCRTLTADSSAKGE
jgi:poly(beta-D-mannuronate) lyase